MEKNRVKKEISESELNNATQSKTRKMERKRGWTLLPRTPSETNKKIENETRDP